MIQLENNQQHILNDTLELTDYIQKRFQKIDRNLPRSSQMFKNYVKLRKNTNDRIK